MRRAVIPRDALWAVVPVKRFALTKRRLTPLLAEREREALARAMLEDVLRALAHSPSLGGTLVVTADSDAAAMARATGAAVMADVADAGMNQAVTAAARHLAAEGRAGMLVIPADVPAITPRDIEAIIGAHRAAPSVTLVPAAGDGGTNALAASPPDVMAFGFGEDSFARHHAAAAALGIAPQVLRLARVERDIDRPADLRAFYASPAPTQTHAWLAAAGFGARVQHVDVSERETVIP